MQFKPLVPGIEVNGQIVYAVVDGFRLFRRLVSAMFAAEGIGRVRFDGDLVFDRNGWYPQAAWLRAFERIASEAGPGALHEIGKRIPDSAALPPTVVDVHTAVQAINIAHHINHRRDGEVMYNPWTGETRRGIGYYGCEIIRERMIVAECKNPYPCAFDRGIMMAMARKFEPHAHVDHAAGPCRHGGADVCNYVITW